MRLYVDKHRTVPEENVSAVSLLQVFHYRKRIERGLQSVSYRYILLSLFLMWQSGQTWQRG